jgi:hypothetical protein
MTRAAFKDGKGAIVSASRSILYAHQKRPGIAWMAAVAEAVTAMTRDVQHIA